MRFTARDTIAVVLAAAALTSAVFAVSVLDEREAAKVAGKEVAHQEEINPVVSVQSVQEPVPVIEVEAEPEATPEPVLIYNIPLDGELQLYIIGLAEEKGIDPAIVFGMIFCESCYKPDVMGDGGNSYGLMQIQPRWHKDRMNKLGVTDLLDPYQNVTVGIDFLAEQIDRYGGDVTKGIVAYNRGSWGGTVTEYAVRVLAAAEELRGELNAIYG